MLTLNDPNAILFGQLVWLLLAIMVVLKFVLASRQIRHVSRHREAVPAAFAETVDLTAHQRAADYTVARVRLARVELALDVLVLLALTFGGGIQRLSDWTSQWWSSSLLQGVALVLSVLLLQSLLGLPMAWWRSFRLEAQFGFNRMTQALFWGDQAKELLISLLVGMPFLALVLWLMQAMGEQWWLYVWGSYALFVLAMLAIVPVWIAPLFNRFSPLEDVELKQRIDALLARCQFSCSGLFVMDGSKRSSHGNAYFTGYGKARRIVFFDNLLKQLSPVEIEAVLAHELGHFKHKHIVQRLVLLLVGSLLVLWLLAQLLSAPWFYAGLGVNTPSMAAALLLLVLVLPVFTFPLQPLMSALSRRQEYQADAYARQQSSAADLISALSKVYRDNAATLTPDPLHSLFYDSHPPASLRIAALQRPAV
jgi:STE24 endopeptidase